MLHLLESGALTKIKHGVKILGAGSEKLFQLGVPINLECCDATKQAIEAVK